MDDWKTLKRQASPYVRAIIHIGDFIWYSTDYDEGERAMVQYCIKTNTIQDICKYPQDMTPMFHSCCLFNDMIYIIDGQHGEIISFNPSTKTFAKKLEIEKIGDNPSCIQLHDKIHIFHGAYNRQHLIYSPIDNQVIVKEDEITTKNMRYVPLINYKNQLCRLGGYSNTGSYAPTDLFLMSNVIEKNDENIIWTEKENLKLKESVYKFGCIIYENFIFTFGGILEGNNYSDNISCLDISNDKNKWKTLEIKCPQETEYTAVLVPGRDDNKLLVSAYIRQLFVEWKMNDLSMDVIGIINDFYLSPGEVHLFVTGFDYQHYSISLSSILKYVY